MPQNQEKSKPTRDQVAVWVERDLDNAVSFLNMLRMTPEVKEALIQIVYDRVLVREENLEKAKEELE